MKNYLNTVERDHLSFLVKMGDRAHQIVEEWKGNLTPSERKYLNTAVTLISKAGSEILLRVNPKDALLVVKRVEGTKMLMLPNDEWLRTVKRYEKTMADDVCSVKVDAFCEVAMAAFEHTCRNCKAQDREKCIYRATYQELELPYYDENAPADRCPYDMRGEEGKKQNDTMEV